MHFASFFLIEKIASNWMDEREDDDEEEEDEGYLLQDVHVLVNLVYDQAPSQGSLKDMYAKFEKPCTRESERPRLPPEVPSEYLKDVTWSIIMC